MSTLPRHGPGGWPYIQVILPAYSKASAPPAASSGIAQ
uniref:Uncharacterized protein n=1 Tax=Arundo donax TaxID=35708 RepID=A0A0A9QJ12_ARUDO